MTKDVRLADLYEIENRIMKSTEMTARFAKKPISKLRDDYIKDMRKLLTALVLLLKSNESRYVWFWWEMRLGTVEMVKPGWISKKGLIILSKLMIVAKAIMQEYYPEIMDKAQSSEDRADEYFSGGCCFGAFNPETYVRPEALIDQLR